MSVIFLPGCVIFVVAIIAFSGGNLNLTFLTFLTVTLWFGISLLVDFLIGFTLCIRIFSFVKGPRNAYFASQYYSWRVRLVRLVRLGFFLFLLLRGNKRVVGLFFTIC